MLKEVCIIPTVFENDTVDSVTGAYLSMLLNILHTSGYLLAPNNKDWFKAAMINLEPQHSAVALRIKSELMRLKNDNRIANQPKRDGAAPSPTEQDWLLEAKHLDAVRRLNCIISRHESDAPFFPAVRLQEENLPERFGFGGSSRHALENTSLQDLLVPFLGYARKLTVIDPYFDPGKNRFKESLLIMSSALGERRGHRLSGTIQIHCRWDEKDDTRKEQTFRYWKDALRAIANESPHRITMNAWDTRPGRMKMHDRYLITDQFGLVSAAGIDVDTARLSEWSLKKQSEVPDVLKDFEMNYTEYGRVFSETFE